MAAAHSNANLETDLEFASAYVEFDCRLSSDKISVVKAFPTKGTIALLDSSAHAAAHFVSWGSFSLQASRDYPKGYRVDSSIPQIEFFIACLDDKVKEEIAQKVRISKHAFALICSGHG